MRGPARLIQPSQLEQRLLVTALEDGPDIAYETWREVRRSVSLDELGHTAFELLPLIYRNVRQAGPEDNDLARLRGVYRRTWVKNNLLLGRTLETADALADENVPALLVEGATLASRVYPELALRPTHVIDVLVDASSSDHALAALGGAGWREPPSVGGTPKAVYYLYDVSRNVLALRSVLGVDVVSPTGGERRHASLLSPAERYRLGDREVLVPRATETLFALIALNARHGNPTRLQWMVDAKMVLLSDIDWQRLATLADDTAQVLRVRDALDLLALLPGARPPEDALLALRRRSTGARQRIAYVFTTTTSAGPAAALVEHLAETSHRPPHAAITGLPGFLRDRWNLRRSWNVPLEAARRSLRRLGGRRSAA
jgi:hypothetical protein